VRHLPLVLLSVLLALGAGWYFGSRQKGGSPTPPTTAGQPATLESLIQGRPDPTDPHDIFQGEAPKPRVFTQPVLGFEARDRGLPTSGTWIGYPMLFDFTADGRADLVASNREEDGYWAWESGADGTWIPRLAGPPEGEGLPRDMQYGPAAAADMNADGIPDLVVSAHSDALRLYLNDGKMSWTRSPGKVQNTFLLLDVATGNLNGDAFPDVAGIAHFPDPGGAALFLGDGQGGLRGLPEAASIFPERTMGKAVKLADLNRDGIDDLVFGCNQGLRAYLVTPGDPFRFEDISAGLPVPTIGNTVYSVVVGKFLPGDGLQIAAAIIANPQDRDLARDYLGVWGYDQDGKSWKHVDEGLPRDEPYRDVVAADFDRDGQLDLLTISIDSGAVIHLNTGAGRFRQAGRLEGGFNKGRAAVGDVDGDGWTDVVVAIPATKEDPLPGRVRCYRNRPEIWKTAGK
jgi:hypothetical protein